MYKSRLKIVREYKGLSRSQLSEKSGINYRSIEAYEQGLKDINNASVKTVLALSKALECDLFDIIG